MTILEFLRRKNGLKQREVAGKLGIHVSLITQVERLYRKPWPKLRKGLSKVYGITEKNLFDYCGWPKEKK